MNGNVPEGPGNLPALRTVGGLITNVSVGHGPGPGPDGGALQVTLSVNDELQQLRLAPDARRFDRWAINTALSKRLPVYTTVADGEIAAVRLPVVGRLSSFEARADGPIHFGVDSSPRRFVLPAAHDARVEAILQQASKSGGIVMVDIDRSGAVLHVDPAPWESWDLALSLGEAHAQPLNKIPLGRVKVSDLPGIFQLVAQEACPIGAPTATCIPFNYPDMGCNARAHKMCTILAAHSVDSAKAWLFDPDMERDTKNIPGCQGSWLYHVVPYVRVHGTGTASVRVLDPSLFPNGAVTLHAFVTGMHSAARHVKYSRLEVYNMSADGSASFERKNQTDDDLAAFREQAADRDPQPPYC